MSSRDELGLVLLHGAMLFAGDCVRGWVTFSVPAGQRPAYAQWDALGTLGASPLRWRL